MKNIEKSTVICSTYNNIKFLELVLDSLLDQSDKDFHLIIADDGSRSETKDLIDSFSKKADFEVSHIWHEDRGWKKAEIHNKAINTVKTDHIIFIDGDCILGKNFIRDHRSIYRTERENFVFMGRRVELGQKISESLKISNYKKLLSPFSFDFILSSLSRDTHGGGRVITLRNLFLRKLFSADKVNDLLGANFSTTKKKLFEINGFNEYTDELGGSEDGDLFVRFRNTGTKLIGKKYFAPMFHIFHKRPDRAVSDDYYQEILKKKDFVWAERGLKK
ncbi:MAG: hypothetical protein CME61_04155 [Halobacteriovoraceae bacterium]|nr:hypothetical protein [Halobacteriovoraceae bacterium]|tara:strand:- start:204 stop:1031 length:828 start_codon:yes stop_codon:yes gene_type:complete